MDVTRVGASGGRREAPNSVAPSPLRQWPTLQDDECLLTVPNRSALLLRIPLDPPRIRKTIRQLGPSYPLGRHFPAPIQDSGIPLRRTEVVRVHRTLAQLLSVAKPAFAESVRSSLSIRFSFDGALSQTAHLLGQTIEIAATVLDGTPTDPPRGSISHAEIHRQGAKELDPSGWVLKYSSIPCDALLSALRMP